MPIPFRITKSCVSDIHATGAKAASFGFFHATTTSFRRRVQGNMIDELPGRAGATLGTTYPPRHDRLRALSQAAFTRKTSENLIAPTLDIADRALERISERREFEFINDFSSQITVGLLFRTMGLLERDHAEIRRKVILAVSTDKSVKGPTAEHSAAFQELSAFLTAEVAARRAKPTDDLITHLAEAEKIGRAHV